MIYLKRFTLGLAFILAIMFGTLLGIATLITFIYICSFYPIVAMVVCIIVASYISGTALLRELEKYG